MKKLALFCLLLLLLSAGSQVKALSADEYQRFKFEVEHSGDAEVRKAAEILIKKGVIRPDKRSARPSSQDTNGSLSDCHVTFNERFIKNILEQDMVSQKLPDGLLELNTMLGESCLNISGRLDGPAFLNPRFSAELDIGFLKANSFRVQVSRIKLAGFKANLFNRMICDYISDAVKRAFPKNCRIAARAKSGGLIHIDVEVEPEGFVPGVSSLGFLSDAGIRNGKMFFCFSIPQNKRKRR